MQKTKYLQRLSSPVTRMKVSPNKRCVSAIKFYTDKIRQRINKPSIGSGTISGCANAVSISLGALALTLTVLLIVTSTQWQFNALVGAPPIGYSILILTPGIGRMLLRFLGISSEASALEKFIDEVAYIDHSWHQPLELAERYLHRQRRLFRIVTQQIFDRYDVADSPENWRYKIGSEITADSLRIADSILSQLRAGHPDTALGTTRQLYELDLFLKVIVIDKSGQSARRYQDYDEANYLTRFMAFTRTNHADYERRLRAFQKEYPGEDFKNDYAWIELPNGKKAGSMNPVIKFIIDEYYEEGPEKEFVLRQYKQMWARLNKWEHITKSASNRKLGIRAGKGYLNAHLVEKSYVGLDTPLSASLMLLGQLLTTYAYIAYDLTGEIHNEYLRESDALLKEFVRALDDVDSSLIAGVKGGAMKDHRGGDKLYHLAHC